jgi:glutathione S-transferase
VTEGSGLVLWGAATTRTMRPLWALHELDLEYEHRPVAPRSGETQSEAFTAVNPRQKVPVLQDGDLTLAESAAIVNYLGDRYGGSSGLVPATGTPERGLYDQWCFFVMTELDAHTLYVMRKHSDLSELYGEAPAAVETAAAGFRKQVAVAAGALSEGGPWLLGDVFTGADILLTTCLQWAEAYGFELAEVLGRYQRQAQQRPAYQSAARVNYALKPDGTSRDV